MRALFGTKACCVLHRVGQLGLELVEGAVGRQVQAVEAGVRLWQMVRISCLFNSEAARTIAALQVLEATDGDLGSSGLQ